MLQPPDTQYNSYEEVGKFNMMWNVSLALIPIFSLLLSLHLLFGESWQTSAAALLVPILNLIILYIVRKYKFVAGMSTVLAIAICQASIYLIPDSHIISDTLWCVMTAFFAYFMFSWIVGSIALILNLTGLTLSVFILEKGSGVNDGVVSEQVDLKLIVNVFYVAIALGFIIYKVVDNNRKINRRYSEQIERNEILLKEIHHRVKNNLQIISSLLRLQSFETDDASVKEHFEQAIGRIRSMALIHEKMYHDDDMSQINLSEYLLSLAKDIMHSIDSATDVDFDVNSDVEDVDIENIVPVSLIFNELITNSLKHGFKNTKEGQLRLQIKRKASKLNFHYSDNGEWKEPIGESSFGLELIETLTQQLDGEWRREIEDGTHYHLSFNADHFLLRS